MNLKRERERGEGGRERYGINTDSDYEVLQSSCL